jgi:hypothetical protein
MTLYAVHVRVLTHETDRHGVTWEGSRGTPTFYLDSRVQGIVSEEHAARIAADVVNPLGTIPAADIHAHAYAVPEGDTFPGEAAAERANAWRHIPLDVM